MNCRSVDNVMQEVDADGTENAYAKPAKESWGGLGAQQASPQKAWFVVTKLQALFYHVRVFRETGIWPGTSLSARSARHQIYRVWVSLALAGVSRSDDSGYLFCKLHPVVLPSFEKELRNSGLRGSQQTFCTMVLASTSLQVRASGKTCNAFHSDGVALDGRKYAFINVACVFVMICLSFRPSAGDLPSRLQGAHFVVAICHALRASA